MSSSLRWTRRTFPYLPLLESLEDRTVPAMFADPISFTTAGEYPGALAFGDFDRDGHQDIAMTRYVAANVTIFRGDGLGNFTEGVTFSANGQRAGQIEAGYFDADNDLDLAINLVDSHRIGVTLGEADDTFGPVVRNPTAGDYPASFVLAYLNGDDHLDIAVLNLGGDNIGILLGNADGSFTFDAGYFAGGHGSFLEAGDLDSDGNVDLMVTLTGAPGTISILMGTGNGAFADAEVIDFAGAYARIAEVTGDNKPDVIGIAPSTNSILVLPGVGDGTFDSLITSTFLTEVPGYYTLADLNGDHVLDLAGKGTQLHIFTGNGDGSFSFAESHDTPSVGGFTGVCDFNADGKPDLATVSFQTTISIQVFLNAATTFGPSDITLSHTTVAENLVANTPIGQLASVNANTGASHTYALVAGDGADDNAAFAIVGNQLQIRYAADFETKATYHIRVQSTDDLGNAIAKKFTINVLDRVERAGSVSATFDGNGNLNVVGTNGNDTILVLQGPSTNQVVVWVNQLKRGTYTLPSLAGRVTVSALGGNDYVLSQWRGPTVILGGAGNDTLLGGPGQNLIHGDAGNDFLRGGASGDYLFGDQGNDRIFGEGGNDYLYGGVGHDTLYGGLGDDSLYGEAGNDFLFGGLGHDRLFASAGYDFWLAAFYRAFGIR